MNGTASPRCPWRLTTETRDDFHVSYSPRSCPPSCVMQHDVPVRAGATSEIDVCEEAHHRHVDLSGRTHWHSRCCIQGLYGEVQNIQFEYIAFVASAAWWQHARMWEVISPNPQHMPARLCCNAADGEHRRRGYHAYYSVCCAHLVSAYSLHTTSLTPF